MKRLLLASAAVLVAGQVQAAEPRYSWTGCYVGGHVGGARNNVRFSEPDETAIFGAQYFAPIGSAISVKQSGGLGGIQAGCDYQFAQNWLAGVGGDLSWANLDGTTADPFFAGKTGEPITLNAKTDRMSTITARVGYAWDRWMVFARGGFARAHNKYSISNLSFFGNPTPDFCATGGPAIACNPAASQTRSGWTVGGGVERALTDHWTVGVEYSHYDFGTRSVVLTEANGIGGTIQGPVFVKQTVDAVKLSVNYRFTPPGVR
jgi:outer membrane immunogenic protein